MNALIENLLKLQALDFDDTVEETDARIAELRAKVPAQILGHYDRLLARGKKGVAIVRNDVCTGCHVQVPRAVTMTLMRNEDIQVCESCGRYLYLAPAPPAPEPKKAGRKTSAKKPELQTV
ncbi:MAG TPA: C4-type zinc ribbon domain-containing protein [Verrucomicrobiae bacterium]